MEQTKSFVTNNLRFFLAFAILFSSGFWYVHKSLGNELRFSDTEIEFEVGGDGIVSSSVSQDIEDDLSPVLGTEPGSNIKLNEFRIRERSFWRELSTSEKKLYGTVQRPAGLLRVGIQPGHYRVDEVPTELARLKEGEGAFGGGASEAQIVFEIAERVKRILESNNIVVDLIPATVPVDYVADAFISIHADGNPNPYVSGFKISGPRRDFSGQSNVLVSALYKSYGEATGLSRDSNITWRMSGYYAFNWRKFDHAVHPMTPSAIVETGFVTNFGDRQIIVKDPDRSARGIANGILEFLLQYRNE